LATIGAEPVVVPPVAADHSVAPVVALYADRVPSLARSYTTPFATAGGPAPAADHKIAPLVASNAHNLAESDAYTTPCATAAVENGLATRAAAVSHCSDRVLVLYASRSSRDR
jgi:hypothetical protein